MKGLWEGRGLSRPGIARCTQRRLVHVKAVPAMINLATRDRGPSLPMPFRRVSSQKMADIAAAKSTAIVESEGRTVVECLPGQVQTVAHRIDFLEVSAPGYEPVFQGKRAKGRLHRAGE